MRLATALACLILLAEPTLARSYSYGHSSHGYYHSTDGSTVHGPTRTANAAYGRVSASCRDGTVSYSHHHSGTCSGHGGVSSFR
jgi:hypothetical protein